MRHTKEGFVVEDFAPHANCSGKMTRANQLAVATFMMDKGVISQEIVGGKRKKFVIPKHQCTD